MESEITFNLVLGFLDAPHTVDAIVFRRRCVQMGWAVESRTAISRLGVLWQSDGTRLMTSLQNLNENSVLKETVSLREQETVSRPSRRRRSSGVSSPKLALPSLQLPEQAKDNNSPGGS